MNEVAVSINRVLLCEHKISTHLGKYQLLDYVIKQI